MPDEPLKLAAKPSKCTEDEDDDEVDDVDDVGMIVLPAAAAALNIDSPGLNHKPKTNNNNFPEENEREKEKEKMFSDKLTFEASVGSEFILVKVFEIKLDLIRP